MKLKMRKLEFDDATTQIAEKEETIDEQSRMIIELGDLVTTKTKEYEEVVKYVLNTPPLTKAMKCIDDNRRKDKLLWRSLSALLQCNDFKEPVKVNSGAYGGVLKAFCKLRKEKVAIKICTAEDKNRKTHNNEIHILKFLSVFNKQPRSPQNDGIQYLMKLHRIIDLNVMGSAFSMPLYQTDLEKMIASGSLKKFKVRRGIYLGLLKGLNFLHSCNIMHRDLKPMNILIDKYLMPCIADFGLCNEASAKSGTDGYIAPEAVANPNDPLDPMQQMQADCWALGKIFYEMVAGFIEKEFKPDYSAFTEVEEELIKALTEENPRLRCSAKQALDMKIFKSEGDEFLLELEK